MSIINQALKKAQRERLFHEPRTLPYLRYRHAARRSRRRFLIVGAGVAILGLTAVWYVRGLAPGRPAALPEPRPPVTAATTSTPRQASGALRQRQRQDPDTSAPESATSTANLRRAPQHTPTGQRRPPSTSARAAAGRQDTAAATLASNASPSKTNAVPPSPPRTQRRPPSAAPPAPAGAQDTAAARADPAAPSPRARSQARELFNRAVESQEASETARAHALLQQAIEFDPTLKVAYNSLGNLHYQQQQYRQALAMYQQALAIDPAYAKARNNLGSTYLQLTMDERALQELHKAVQADSGYGLAYYNLACVYARAGDSATAAQYLQRAITIEPQARAWAQTDDDFTRVRTAPEVLKLLESS